MEIPFFKKFFGEELKAVKLPIISEMMSGTRYMLPTTKNEDGYLKEYKNWVYTCVNARAEELASIEIVVKSKKTGDPLPRHDLLDLLDDVNPNTTRYQLFFGTQAFLDLTGNAYWYLARENEGTGKIKQIYLLAPDKMQIITDKANPLNILGYMYVTGKEKIPFDAKQILHFRNFNPNGKYPNPHKGMGIVEAALWAIETDNEARNWNYSFFKNSAKPDGILTTETVMGDEQFKRLKDQWNQEFRGTNKTGKMALLENGTKWQDISKTQKDMDFVAQRTFSRDEILSLFRTPKTVVGITDDVNRANAEASDYVFARRTIKPLMKAFITVLNEYLVPEFDSSIVLDFKDPVPEDRAATILEYTNGMNKWLSRNDIRRREGLDPSDNGDTFYGSFGDVAQDTVPPKTKSLPAGSRNEKHVDKVVDNFIAKLPKKKDVRKLTDAQKSVYKEVYIKRFDENEKKLKTDVSNFFEEQEEEVQENLKDEFNGLKPKEFKLKGVNDILFDKKKAVGASISLITPFIREFIKDGAQMADANTGGNFNLNHADTLNFINERAKFFAETINETTREELLSSIKEGVDNAEGFDEISKRISDVYKNAEAYRVERIARTEVATALNEGAVQAYKQVGVNKLEWVAVLDDRTSDECLQNDGEVREIGKEFPAGAAQPPQHVNCRCSVVAVFED